MGELWRRELGRYDGLLMRCAPGTHEAAAAILLKHVKDRPAVLMGDFNMWRWATRFIVPGWRDTVRGATWPATRPYFQIDHILTKAGVSAVETEVVHIGGSDHLPIRAQLSVH